MNYCNIPRSFSKISNCSFVRVGEFGPPLKLIGDDAVVFVFTRCCCCRRCAFLLEGDAFTGIVFVSTDSNFFLAVDLELDVDEFGVDVFECLVLLLRLRVDLFVWERLFSSLPRIGKRVPLPFIDMLTGK
jgi:hypothetical protein